MEAEHLVKELSKLSSILLAGIEQKKIEFEWLKLHCELATKQDLIAMENRIIMQIQEATDALNALSTASDGLSVKVDKLVDATNGLIAAVKAGGGVVSPELAAAITKAQAAASAAAAEGDKVDAAVASADEVLPTPAPAATP